MIGAYKQIYSEIYKVVDEMADSDLVILDLGEIPNHVSLRTNLRLHAKYGGYRLCTRISGNKLAIAKEVP